MADESSMDIHLENILKKHKHLNEISSKILEINPDHNLIKFLNKIDTNDKKLTENTIHFKPASRPSKTP